MERIRERIAGSSIIFDIEPIDSCGDAGLLIIPFMPELGLGLSAGSLASAPVGTDEHRPCSYSCHNLRYRTDCHVDLPPGANRIAVSFSTSPCCRTHVKNPCEWRVLPMGIWKPRYGATVRDDRSRGHK